MPRDVTGDRHLLDCASNSAEAAELRRGYAAVLRSLGLVPLFTVEVQAPRRGRRGYLISVFGESGEREP